MYLGKRRLWDRKLALRERGTVIGRWMAKLLWLGKRREEEDKGGRMDV